MAKHQYKVVKVPAVELIIDQILELEDDVASPLVAQDYLLLVTEEPKEGPLKTNGKKTKKGTRPA